MSTRIGTASLLIVLIARSVLIIDVPQPCNSWREKAFNLSKILTKLQLTNG